MLIPTVVRMERILYYRNIRNRCAMLLFKAVLSEALGDMKMLIVLSVKPNINLNIWSCDRAVLETLMNQVWLTDRSR